MSIGLDIGIYIIAGWIITVLACCTFGYYVLYKRYDCARQEKFVNFVSDSLEAQPIALTAALVIWLMIAWPVELPRRFWNLHLILNDLLDC